MANRFEPQWYMDNKAMVREIQTNCLGFHAPETKKLCGQCVAKAIIAAAKGERERCALYLETCKEFELATDLRNLE
jgi:hypothetical protein